MQKNIVGKKHQHDNKIKIPIFAKTTDMQVKEEISHIVDTLPEDFLNELLQYLKKLEKASKDKATLSLHLNTILIEDNDVLAKLAQ
jgi:hypothetical protein